MATTPQFGAEPILAYNANAITAANTAMDGTGTVVFLEENVAGTRADWIAGPGGAFIDMLSIRSRGTNVQTVMRLFANMNASNGTAVNNDLLEEATCPATTASNIAALAPVNMVVKKWVPEGTKLFVTIGTAVAAGFSATMYGSQM